jgi:hypothetical protein
VSSGPAVVVLDQAAKPLAALKWAVSGGSSWFLRKGDHIAEPLVISLGVIVGNEALDAPE